MLLDTKSAAYVRREYEFCQPAAPAREFPCWRRRLANAGGPLTSGSACLTSGNDSALEIVLFCRARLISQHPRRRLRPLALGISFARPFCLPSGGGLPAEFIHQLAGTIACAGGSRDKGVSGARRPGSG